MTEPLELVGTTDVIRLTGRSRYEVETWLSKGCLIPQATVSTRHIWTAAYIQKWLDAGGLEAVSSWTKEGGCEGAPVIPAEPLDLVGIDYIADLFQVGRRTVLHAQAPPYPPEPDAKLPGVKVWARRSIDDWAAPLLARVDA